MIALALDEVRTIAPGALTVAPGAAEVTGVVIDSRRARTGDLFVAVGRGIAHVDDALRRGAAAALVPHDAHAALAALGSAVRDRSAARVVGITGSTGKTSTKDILAAICKPHARVVAAEASFNNELGVPLTLCRLEPGTEICIVELAMRGLGQIAELAAVARPHVGVVTNVGPAHLELVGSLEAVVEAKGELIESLPRAGIAVVPEDFPVARDDLEVIRVGEPRTESRDGTLAVRYGDREVEFTLRARHQARNALAALHAADALGIRAGDRVDVELSRWRGETADLPGGGELVNDCWNANPLSMRAALEDLADRADGRRTVAVLGEMAELGAGALAYHEEIGALAGDLGVDVLLAVGPLGRAYVDQAATVPVREWAADAAEAARRAAALVRPGDLVLVKASRSVGLEAVAGALVSRPD